VLRNLKNFIFLALGLGLLFLAFRGQDTTQLVKEFAQARYHWILLSIGLGVLSHISRAMRWRMLIRPMGYQVRLDHSLYAVMVGYMVNLAVPRMGEFSRCVVLSRAGEAPANKLFGTVIAERAIDLLALITLFLLTLAFEFEVIWGFISQQMQRLVGRKTETVSDAADTWPLFLALAFGALLLLGLIFAWIRRNQKLRARLRAFWQELREGLTTIGKLENYALFCLHTAFIWLMYYLMGYVAFFALPATAGLDYSVALSTFCLGGLGFAAPVQGGIGAFHRRPETLRGPRTTRARLRDLAPRRASHADAGGRRAFDADATADGEKNEDR
jgi:uncharacterized membrane protein YbhN (UPF0104 family)